MTFKIKNPFESGERKIIPAVLLYATHQNRMLMIHRNTDKNDFHQGKWNGLGGKMEANETPEECAVREFHEESSCLTQKNQWKWVGILQFPDFKPLRNEDWWVTLFTTELNSEQVRQIQFQNAEGTLHWMPSDEVLSLNLWEGDRKFLPWVLKGTPIRGSFFYRSGKLDRFVCDPVLD